MAVEAHSERLAVVVPVALQDAMAVAEALAHEPEVMWVEPHQEFQAFNVQGVTASQSGSADFPGGRPATVDTTPIWDMGLHGENEIIGVGDSGLDTGHCFFEEAQGGTPGTQNYGPDHRKVVAYRAYADGGAGENERGSAYAAKVSFTDIGPGDAPGLQVPNDLAGNFFNIDYDNGARIHSNSWGANVNAYTTSTVGTDQAMYDMDDLVILFAAGNSGNPDRTPSIGAPATCKNCITVGATENDNSQTQVGDGELAVFSSTGLAVGGRIKPDVTAPGFFISSANSNADGDCPITESNVALIRQYLREGFYPTGKRGN